MTDQTRSVDTKCRSKLDNSAVFEASGTIRLYETRCDLSDGHDGVHRSERGEMWSDSWAKKGADR